MHCQTYCWPQYWGCKCDLAEKWLPVSWNSCYSTLLDPKQSAQNLFDVFKNYHLLWWTELMEFTSWGFLPQQPQDLDSDSFHFGIGPNQSQFTAGFASGLVFSCIILDSLFQPSIFHKSLISLVLGKADVLIYILRFSVEFNVLAENPHNTEHECQVTTTVAGAALQ